MANEVKIARRNYNHALKKSANILSSRCNNADHLYRADVRLSRAYEKLEEAQKEFPDQVEETA